MQNNKNNLGFWFKFIASFFVATFMSIMVAFLNIAISMVVCDFYRSITGYTGDMYWVLGYSFVVWIISWIVSFGYLMSE
jgi:hypothetical protein